MDFSVYIKPELLILAPVMYIIGVIIKTSKTDDRYIPLILGIISVVLSGVHIFSATEIKAFTEVLAALFCSVCQGVLIAGSSVYADQIKKQLTQKKEGTKDADSISESIGTE